MLGTGSRKMVMQKALLLVQSLRLFSVAQAFQSKVPPLFSSISISRTPTALFSSQSAIPRAAVSCVVRNELNNEVKYVLVQRGKEPNKGIWSFPGGKIESGERSFEAAMRELEEETGLSKDMDDYVFNWCEKAPICTTDSIHSTSDGEEEIVSFHYVISQWFVDVNSKDSTKRPTLKANDDAADAKWFSFKDIQKGIQNGEITPGVEPVLERTELMHQKGLLE